MQSNYEAGLQIAWPSLAEGDDEPNYRVCAAHPTPSSSSIIGWCLPNRAPLSPALCQGQSPNTNYEQFLLIK
jgi:hypothetical protein